MNTQLALANQQLQRLRHPSQGDNLDLTARMEAMKAKMRTIPGKNPIPDDSYPMAGIPTLGQLDTSSPKMATAVALAKKWLSAHASGKTPSLVLYAVKGKAAQETGYGCGKTHIARALLFDNLFAIRHEDGNIIGSHGVFLTAQRAIDALGEDGMKIQRLLNYRHRWHKRLNQMVMAHPPVVVVDDVGTEVLDYDPDRSKRHGRWYQLVNHCYEANIAMIVTANLNLDELTEALGGRAISRLMEMAERPFIFDMTGVPDYRIKNGGR